MNLQRLRTWVQQSESPAGQLLINIPYLFDPSCLSHLSVPSPDPLFHSRIFPFPGFVLYVMRACGLAVVLLYNAANTID